MTLVLFYSVKYINMIVKYIFVYRIVTVIYKNVSSITGNIQLTYYIDIVRI